MKHTVAILLLIALTAPAVAQDVPRIRVEQSCRAAAKGTIGLSETYESCMRSEQEARDKLAAQWRQFPAADRQSCHSLTTTGTPGTYTELLTCLEMKREARKLPDTSTVGRGLRTRE